jgi:hypothetical protein
MSGYDRITDVVAKGDGHDLSIRHITCSGGIMNHFTTGNITGRRWSNWQCDRFRSPADSLYRHSSVPDRPSNAALATSLIKKTNPSRPDVDLPVAIFELKDMPSLLATEGRNLIRMAAAKNLQYQFAIKPFVSDVFSLLNFVSLIANREKELKKLHESGLRRRRLLWSGVSTETVDTIVQSGDGVTVHYDMHYATQKKIYGFVEWFPPATPLMKGDLRKQARRAALGLTVDLSTAWELMPWSWLVDWSFNVGSVLSATRNIVGASHGPCQIMEETVTSVLGVSPSLAVGRYSPFSARIVDKQRRTEPGVSVDVQMPLLTGRQLSILGSIGVTRRMPRS